MLGVTCPCSDEEDEDKDEDERGNWGSKGRKEIDVMRGEDCCHAIDRQGCRAGVQGRGAERIR